MKKISNKLLVLLMALIVVMSLVGFSNDAPSIISDGPTVYLDVIEATSEEELLAKFEEETITPRAAALYAGVTRDGNTTDCGVYLHWVGMGARYNGWRFKEVTVSNGSSLNYEEYGSIGNGITWKTYNVDSSRTGSVYLGEIEIPTSVTRVAVDFDELQGSMSASDNNWLSALTTQRMTTIN